MYSLRHTRPLPPELPPLEPGMRGSTIAFRIEAANRPVALTQYPLARAAGTLSPCVAEKGEEPAQCGSLTMASENVT